MALVPLGVDGTFQSTSIPSWIEIIDPGIPVTRVKLKLLRHEFVAPLSRELVDVRNSPELIRRAILEKPAMLLLLDAVLSLTLSLCSSIFSCTETAFS